MKCLFVFAHPDDESVASGGTARMLSDLGWDTKVVLATAGGAGEIAARSQKDLIKFGSIETLRKNETENACKHLVFNSLRILKFPDGQITNKDTWASLENKIRQEIETYKPDMLVTFDHSGWYYHLDHVGVSIATTRAVYEAKHKVDVFLFALFRPKVMKLKWKYVYSEKLPATHFVDIKSVLKEKIKAIKAHRAQTFGFLPFLEMGLMNKEYFQLVYATSTGRKYLGKSIFKKLT